MQGQRRSPSLRRVSASSNQGSTTSSAPAVNGTSRSAPSIRWPSIAANRLNCAVHSSHVTKTSATFIGVNRPDWVQWHNLYETPERVVAQRLMIVQRLIRDFLASRSGDEIRIVSMCSGQG